MITPTPYYSGRLPPGHVFLSAITIRIMRGEQIGS